MGYAPLTKYFLDAVDQRPTPQAQMFRGPSAWQSISSTEMLRRVAGLSKCLFELGIKPGDRVAIFAPNCPEWHVADFAILGVGAASVPVYFNESADRMTYILNDSGARIAITSGAMQARRLAECRPRLTSIEHVISANSPDAPGEDVLRYETLISSSGEQEIGEYRRRCAGVTPEQLATIIYTSGTTGEPKGVMLTHANLSSNALDSCDGLEYFPSDLSLSFLPLAHVYERVAGYTDLFKGVGIAYVEQIESVPQSLLEVHPTIAAAVPRFFEKMYANILAKGHQEKGLKRKIFDWALGVADKAQPWKAYGRSVSSSVRMQWKIANTLVYSKIREGLGGKIRLFISGGAPLSTDIAAFFWSINIPIYQGYGLTETSPVVAVNTPLANRVGTVGKPIRHVEVKIAEDGEILVKGPCVMQGYYRKPDQTRETFSPDGWFCTGDIGRLDQDGYLIITDRKKELLKTAAGKFIAPAPIENLLKTSRYIANAVVVGDKRKFVSVLIVPNLAAIETEAGETGRAFSTPSQMILDPWVRDLIAAEIERLTSALAQYEKPKRFALLEKDFSYSDGELTYTLKMKRRIIEQRYQDVISRLYADVEDPRPHHVG
ncbi:MAG TPA: long-chain fatty acid--CoA ligase [Verrucomicrobiae bacterium]|nr:long-chain fatty acid--CoA ligase [Verrucomicrobiae bacterium]